MTGPESMAIFAFFLLFLRTGSAFTGLQTSTPHHHHVKALSSSSSSGDDLDFMASLKSRMDQVNDNESLLPLVVLDSMLPRQVLKINVNNPVFMELVRTRLEAETPFFGMLGMAKLATGEQVHLRTGVQVDIVGKPAVDDDNGSLNIELRAGQRFQIEGDSVDNAPQGWTEARVKFLKEDDDDEEANIISTTNELDRLSLARAISKANKLSDLIDEWIALARTNERQEGQIDQLLVDLGDFPAAEQVPTERAFWVGALINPIPAMGVALEIRPALLTAKTAEDRVDVALKGIQRSIEHMQGKNPIT